MSQMKNCNLRGEKERKEVREREREMTAFGLRYFSVKVRFRFLNRRNEKGNSLFIGKGKVNLMFNLSRLWT